MPEELENQEVEPEIEAPQEELNTETQQEETEIPSQEDLEAETQLEIDVSQLEIPQVVVPVETREMTRMENEKGKINIIHEITVGDLLVSTSLFAILIFMVLSRIIRR